MLWDVFCRVVDNFGDIGVCWRLARDLTLRGESVRLWVDDASALAWMAPDRPHGLQVIAWGETPPDLDPGDVVVEVFGCDPPETFVARMHRDRAPVWVNLEYLSAEPHVERCHGLPSPQLAGPGLGLTKRFYFPGFTAKSGGLIREQRLEIEQAAFDRAVWLAERGLQAAPAERIVGLYCYDNPALPQLLRELAHRPTLLLVTPDHAARQVSAALGASMRSGALRAHLLPYLTQTDFDRLLWACDLNFVRGEDSFVRAQLAGRPFVWHIYPQSDGAHAIKLETFLSLYLHGATSAFGDVMRRLSLAWNGFGHVPAPLPADGEWAAHAAGWRARLYTQTDLSTRLLSFVAEKG